MIETQRMVASKLETVESRAANAQQKLEATQVRFRIDRALKTTCKEIYKYEFQNELMEARTKFEEDRIAKNEEMELIMNDLGKKFVFFYVMTSRWCRDLSLTENHMKTRDRNRGSIKPLKCEKVLSLISHRFLLRFLRF